MNRFVAHLAGRARGEPTAGAAMPSLPSRFAGPQAGIDGGMEMLEAVAPSSDRPVGDAPVAILEPGKPTGDQISTAPQLGITPAARADAAIALPLERAITAPVRPIAGVAHPPAPTVDSPAPPYVMPRLSRGPELTAPPVVEPIAPPMPGSPISAPLTEAAVAGRAKAAQAPVVHVTIDRIDVRVPAAAPPTAPERRARAQPSVSLADYLAGGARGGRA